MIHSLPSIRFIALKNPNFSFQFVDPLSVQTLPSNSFLLDARTFQTGSDGKLIGDESCLLFQLASRCSSCGSALLESNADLLLESSSAAIAIPVYRAGSVNSVVVLSTRSGDDSVGVFEIWEPVGIYEEVSLTQGFYGVMDRFRNVSSYVRFEIGRGLPGQVWDQKIGVIHDDLSNHPGFLRAAGASADLLQTAIGIPVATKDNFFAAALLISSSATPLARAYEVWEAKDDGFSLVSRGYQDLDESLRREHGSTMGIGLGLAGLAASEGSAVTCEDPTVLFAGLETGPIPQAGSGLAIPYFDGDKLSSVTTLIF